MELGTLIYAALSALFLAVVAAFGAKKVINSGRSLRKENAGIGGAIATILVLGWFLIVILVLPLGIVLVLKYTGAVGDDRMELGVVYFASVLSGIIAAHYFSRSQ